MHGPDTRAEEQELGLTMDESDSKVHDGLFMLSCNYCASNKEIRVKCGEGIKNRGKR